MRFLTALFLAAVLAGVQASAQTIFGRHWADTVVPQLFQQNGNAETVVAGINGAHDAVTNVDLSAIPYPASWPAGGGAGLAAVVISNAPNATVLLAGNGLPGTPLTATAVLSNGALLYEEPGVASGALLFDP